MKKHMMMLLAGFVLLIGFQTAGAAMVTTSSLLAESSLVNIYSPQDVRAVLTQDLIKLGVPANDAQHRVSLLTNEQIASLNTQIETMPAGGDVVGIAVLVFLVFVITDVIGATDIFSFIDPI